MATGLPARVARLAASTATLALTISGISIEQASAQTVDYGSFEQLFGEPVTTSATGSPQRAGDVPANMEIVTAEDIRRSGASSIPGVLSHVLGIDFLQWTAGDADIGILGYNQALSPRLLVLIDGRQVYADHNGYTPWDALPVELGEIRQIEVVRGPNAALFGFNAVSGVINIITYNPLYDKVNTASLTGGTQGLVQGSLVNTLRAGDKSALRLSMGGHIDDDFSTAVPPAIASHPRKPEHRFAFDADGIVRLADHVQLRINASHSGAASNYVNSANELTNVYHYFSSIKGELSADTDIGLIQATLYKNWTTQHVISFFPRALRFNNEVTVAQLQDVFRVESAHTFRLSTEYRYNTVNTSPFEGGRIFYNVFSAGAMWNWELMPALSLTNAIRFDDVGLGRSGPVPAAYPFANSHRNRSIREWSFNSGLVWKPGKLDTFRLLAGRGVQLPDLANLGGLLFTSPGFTTTGSPSLEPSSLLQYELDWDHALPAIDAKLSSAIFYKHISSVFATGAQLITPSGLSPVSASANIGSSDAYGMELSLKGKIGKGWRWGASYRYESTDDHFTFTTGSFIDFEHTTPEHVVKANLGWSNARWEIDGYLHYQSKTQGIGSSPGVTSFFLTPVKAFLSMDGRIAYRLTDQMTFAVSGQNLLESPQQQTAGPKVERRVMATVSVGY
jgi:outer membrane receptor protein involved in Fe transport